MESPKVTNTLYKLSGKLSSNRNEMMAEAMNQLVQQGSLKVDDVDKLKKHGTPQEVIDLYKKNHEKKDNIFKRGIKWVLNSLRR